MKYTLLCLLSFVGVTAVFVILNNVPRIPPPITMILWHGYLPFLAFFWGYARGKAQKKSGTTVPLLALILAPILWFSVKYALPFASSFTHIPSLLAMIPCALLGEILGKPPTKTT
ncbi:MAG: hypothetical protein IJO94_02895 [Firmicutes bacterium]|nr:hypothetical protein [Bacillota bacterium]